MANPALLSVECIEYIQLSMYHVECIEYIQLSMYRVEYIDTQLHVLQIISFTFRQR